MNVMTAIVKCILYLKDSPVGPSILRDLIPVHSCVGDSDPSSEGVGYTEHTLSRVDPSTKKSVE